MGNPLYSALSLSRYRMIFSSRIFFCALSHINKLSRFLSPSLARSPGSDISINFLCALFFFHKNLEWIYWKFSRRRCCWEDPFIYHLIHDFVVFRNFSSNIFSSFFWTINFLLKDFLKTSLSTIKLKSFHIFRFPRC